MQEGSNPKQLIAEKIKQSANILVTVSANPSVDSLTASLGLTLILNKLDKHATAVFSGVIPPAITFLEPGRTFENNIDSLRDFIIALDKEKADRLRYKVEDDVVRIFITPYRTKISERDLHFSQGDFNVDLIIALGVEDQRDLDQAITAHGRILHDATVVTINASAQKSSLGSIDWQDGNASSLSEMLASIAEQLKPGILDQQISTALLTGIVASTERFSNQHTTPRVMTVAAQLMAAGANQQLIATKLQTIPAPVSPRREKPKQDNKPQDNKRTGTDEGENNPDGEMHIQHEKPLLPAPAAPAPNSAPRPKPEPESASSQAKPEPKEPELAIAPPPAQNFNDLKQAIEEATPAIKPQQEMLDEPPAPGSHNINDDSAVEPKTPKSEEESYLSSHPSWQGREINPPTMGGTLNATAERALEDKQREEVDEKRNHKILSHDGAKGGRKSKGRSQQKFAPKQEKKVEPAPISAPEPLAPEPSISPTPQMAQPEPILPPVPPLPQLPVAEATPQPPAPSEPAMSPPEEAPQANIPIAPPPLVVSEPLSQPQRSAEPEVPSTPVETPPGSQPAALEPAPSPAHKAPTLEELEREATTHAAQSAAPQTLSELEAERKQIKPAIGQSAVPSASDTQPAPSASQGGIPGMPPMPPMPDFGTLPPLPGEQPGVPGSVSANTSSAPAANPLPQESMPTPKLPDLPTLPVQPPTQMPQEPNQPQIPQTPPPPQPPADPAQFRIPGQQ